MNLQSIDTLPIWVVIGLFAVITLADLRGRVPDRALVAGPDARRAGGPAGVLIGALLGLMAFMLAVDDGHGGGPVRRPSRHGPRRGERHRQGLPRGGLHAASPQAEQLRELLREYLPLRIATDDLPQVQAAIQRSIELHAEMWAIVAAGRAQRLQLRT